MPKPEAKGKGKGGAPPPPSSSSSSSKDTKRNDKKSSAGGPEGSGGAAASLEPPPEGRTATVIRPLVVLVALGQEAAAAAAAAAAAVAATDEDGKQEMAEAYSDANLYDKAKEALGQTDPKIIPSLSVVGVADAAQTALKESLAAVADGHGDGDAAAAAHAAASAIHAIFSKSIASEVEAQRLRVKELLQSSDKGATEQNQQQQEEEEDGEPAATPKLLEQATPKEIYNHFFIGTVYGAPDAVLEAFAMQCKELAAIFLVRTEGRPPVKPSSTVQDSRERVVGNAKLALDLRVSDSVVLERGRAAPEEAAVAALSSSIGDLLVRLNSVEHASIASAYNLRSMRVTIPKELTEDTALPKRMRYQRIMGAISVPESNEVAYITHAMLEEVCSANDTGRNHEDNVMGGTNDLKEILSDIVSSAVDCHIPRAVYSFGAFPEKSYAGSITFAGYVDAEDRLAKLEYQAANGGFASPDAEFTIAVRQQMRAFLDRMALNRYTSQSPLDPASVGAPDPAGTLTQLRLLRSAQLSTISQHSDCNLDTIERARAMDCASALICSDPETRQGGWNELMSNWTSMERLSRAVLTQVIAGAMKAWPIVRSHYSPENDRLVLALARSDTPWHKWSSPKKACPRQVIAVPSLPSRSQRFSAAKASIRLQPLPADTAHYSLPQQKSTSAHNVEHVLLPGGAIFTTHSTDLVRRTNSNRANPEVPVGLSQRVDARALCDFGDLVLSFGHDAESRMLQLDSASVSLSVSTTMVESTAGEESEEKKGERGEEEEKQPPQPQPEQEQEEEGKSEQGGGEEEEHRHQQEPSPPSPSWESHAQVHVASSEGVTFVVDMSPSGISVYQSPLTGHRSPGQSYTAEQQNWDGIVTPPELFRCVTKDGNVVRKFRSSKDASPASYQTLRADGSETTAYASGSGRSSRRTATSPRGSRWEHLDKAYRFNGALFNTHGEACASREEILKKLQESSAGEKNKAKKKELSAEEIEENHPIETITQVVNKLQPVRTAAAKDYDSGAVVLTREDDTVIVQYANGAAFSQHRDGTRMLANSDRSMWRVERQGYYPVQFRNGIVSVHLPDGLIVRAQPEQQQIQFSAQKIGRVPLHFAADYNGPSPTLKVSIAEETHEVISVDLMTSKSHANTEHLTEILAREHEAIDARLFVCSPSLHSGCEFFPNARGAGKVEVEKRKSATHHSIDQFDNDGDDANADIGCTHSFVRKAAAHSFLERSMGKLEHISSTEISPPSRCARFASMKNSSAHLKLEIPQDIPFLGFDEGDLQVSVGLPNVMALTGPGEQDHIGQGMYEYRQIYQCRRLAKHHFGMLRKALDAASAIDIASIAQTAADSSKGALAHDDDMPEKEPGPEEEIAKLIQKMRDEAKKSKTLASGEAQQAQDPADSALNAPSDGESQPSEQQDEDLCEHEILQAQPPLPTTYQTLNYFLSPEGLTMLEKQVLEQGQRMQGDSHRPPSAADGLPLSELNPRPFDGGANSNDSNINPTSPPRGKNSGKGGDEENENCCNTTTSALTEGMMSHLLIYPSVVSFANLEIGKTVSKRLKVCNTSPVNIRFRITQSPAGVHSSKTLLPNSSRPGAVNQGSDPYSLSVKYKPGPIAPGMSLIIVVDLTPHPEILKSSRRDIQLHINFETQIGAIKVGDYC